MFGYFFNEQAVHLFPNDLSTTKIAVKKINSIPIVDVRKIYLRNPIEALQFQLVKVKVTFGDFAEDTKYILFV